MFKKRQIKGQTIKAQIIAHEAIFNRESSKEDSLLQEAEKGTEDIEKQVRYLERLKEETDLLKSANQEMERRLDERFEKALARAKAAAAAEKKRSFNPYLKRFEEAMAKAEAERPKP